MGSKTRRRLEYAAEPHQFGLLRPKLKKFGPIEF
jgi:hypothetical protein